MKKRFLSYNILLLTLITALSAMPCQAALSTPKAPAGSGKKKLLLFAKNPATWAIIKNGATGKMVYRESTGAFTLSAAGLRSGSAYALIRYADEPPKVEILAKGTTDKRGKLELSGNWHNWTKKFWVVPAEDVGGKVGEVGALAAWRPDRYLFEEKQLGIPCLCPEPEEP